jgi:ribonuclease BN (tRNA processing enzyme)
MPDSAVPSLSLENNGHLGITFIGAGSAFSKRYYQTNPLIVKGRTHLMVDIGTRAPEALARLGLPVTKLENFFITHCHADHIGGLEEVMLMGRYFSKKKPNIIIDKDFQKHLWQNSLRGGCAFNEEHEGRPLEFEDFWVPIRPKPVKDSPRLSRASLGGQLDLTIFRTKHIPDTAVGWEDSSFSYGLIIDGKVLFTGDTRYDPEMILDFDAQYHFKAIFHDCQLFTGGVHASLDELSGLPDDIKRRIYLVHYQDSAESRLEEIMQRGFAGLVREWQEYRFD